MPDTALGTKDTKTINTCLASLAEEVRDVQLLCSAARATVEIQVSDLGSGRRDGEGRKEQSGGDRAVAIWGDGNTKGMICVKSQ